MKKIKPLTVKELDKKPEKLPAAIPDGDNLYFCWNKDGSRRVWRYKISKPRTWKTLGEYPKMSLKAAREERDRLKLKIKDEGCYIKPRAENIGSTFADAALSWLKEANSTSGSAGTHKDRQHKLEAFLLPALGSRDMRTLKTFELVDACCVPFKQNSKTYVHIKLAGIIRQIFDFARMQDVIPLDYCPDMPIRKYLPKPPPTEHRRCIFTPAQLAKLLKDIRSAYRCGGNKRVQSLGLSLLLYSGVRVSELVGAKWEEVSTAEKQWIIPAERMKKKREHIVPLSRQVLALLEELKMITPASPYLFPAQKPLSFESFFDGFFDDEEDEEETAEEAAKHLARGTLYKLLVALGWQGKMTLHGMRGTFSTMAYEAGAAEAHIELTLSHLEGSTVKRSYNHYDFLPERAELLQAWADYLDSVQSGSDISFRDFTRQRKEQD